MTRVPNATLDRASAAIDEARGIISIAHAYSADRSDVFGGALADALSGAETLLVTATNALSELDAERAGVSPPAA